MSLVSLLIICSNEMALWCTLYNCAFYIRRACTLGLASNKVRPMLIYIFLELHGIRYEVSKPELFDPVISLFQSWSPDALPSADINRMEDEDPKKSPDQTAGATI